MKDVPKRKIARAARKILANERFLVFTRIEGSEISIVKMCTNDFGTSSYSGMCSRFLNLGIYFYSDPFLAYQAAEFQFCPRLFGISV